jgi:3-methyladenine DNA glycosylase AlkD
LKCPFGSPEDGAQAREYDVNVREAQQLGTRIASLVQAGQLRQAYTLLAPVLAERTRFPVLGRIGETIAVGPSDKVNALLKHIAAQRTEGGWVVIGNALGKQLERDFAGAFDRCRDYVAAADVWYAADILGERVPGPALLTRFEPALGRLAAWREDENRWVRRTVGVAVHFWAKRTRGVPEETPQAETLLAFLDPMFSEWNLDATKGVGWGLKTLGRYYPDLVADWLAEQVVHRQRRHRALMLRKAQTYLSHEQRTRVTARAH